jgi:hypothetical protein
VTPTTALGGRRKMLPQSCVVRQRVEAALASGLEGNERSDVELWLEGYRRLTPSMLSLPDLDGVEIRVRKPLRAANQRLMDYLGVSVVVDEDAPPDYSFGDVIGNRQLRLGEMAGRR